MPWIIRHRKAGRKRLPKSAIIRQATEKIVSEKMYLNPALKRWQVAKAIGTNRTYLWESLRSKGFGFQEYLSRFRLRHFIERAHGYKDLSFREIAELCGFNDPKQLNRYLQKMFGVNLAEYMNWVENGL